MNNQVKYNLGSGQRPFQKSWINVDCQERFNPDICSNLEDFFDGTRSGTADAIVLHQVLEHFNLEGGENVIKECFRLLNPGGVLFVSVPDSKSLANAWLNRKIDDYIWRTSMHGAYMGNEADVHRWSYTAQNLVQTLKQCGEWRSIKLGHDDERLADADIASDWWILEVCAVKA